MSREPLVHHARAAASSSLLRFGAASVASTLVTLAGLGLLLQVSPLTPGWANAVATSAGTVVAYDLNRRWVWGAAARGPRAGDFAAFWALSLAGLGLSTMAVGAVGGLLAADRVAAALRTAVLQGTNLSCFASLTAVKFLVSRGLFRRTVGGGPDDVAAKSR